MPIDSVATFVRLVEQLGLLPPDQRSELARLARTAPPDPRAFAKDVLQRSWLTAYQINQLFQDNGPALVLGKYVLLERLGAGGMGQVFKARQQGLDRIVALKIINPDRLNNPTVVRRFKREILLSAQLDHPNVVHAFDAEQQNDTHFLVMEYVEGIDLGRLVRENGPLSVPLACEYIRQAALGLQHAHEKGLVHRDIKPANLLLTQRLIPGRSSPEPVVKLLDLGLAQLQQPTLDHSGAGLTAAGVVVGTVDFLAPEQARDARHVDIRADLYSLGCTFYYLLTAQVPFAGATATNKIFKHALEDPEPIESLRPDVPPAVRDVVRCLMAKRPQDRFSSPAELATALEDLLKGRPPRLPAPPRAVAVPVTPADPPPPAKPAAATPVRKPNLATMPVAPVNGPPKATPTRPTDWWQWVLLNVIGVIVILILIAVFIVIYRRSQGLAGGRIEPLPVAESPVTTELEALRRRERDPSSDREQLRQDVLAFRRAHATAPETFAAAELLHRLPSPLDGLDGTLPAEVEAPRPRPVELVGAVGGPAGRPRGPIAGLAFTVDGRKMFAAFRSPPWAALWNLPPEKATLAFDLRGEPLTAAISSDGRWALVCLSKRNDLALWDLEGKRERRRLEGHRKPVQAVAFSADGKLAVSASADGTARTWNIEEGKEIRRLDRHTRPVVGVALTPNEEAVVTASEDGTVRVWDRTTGQERQMMNLTKAPQCLAVTPDGKAVLIGTARGVVERRNLDGTPAGAELTGLGDVRALAVTPDGRLVAATDGKGNLVVWEVASGERKKQLKLPGELPVLTWASDSRHLAVGNSVGAVYILRLP